MHDIEPHFRWRETYTAETDRRSPFFGRSYSEFEFSNRLYNFYLHPQWDEFGSSTLYCKILSVDYDDQFALIELIGEWNDALHNDIMYLKRNVVDVLFEEGVNKFVFFCDHVLNFHAAADDDYYVEWSEEVRDDGGWIVLINTREHVEEEMSDARLHHYLTFGESFNHFHWTVQKPLVVFQMVEQLLNDQPKLLN